MGLPSLSVTCISIPAEKSWLSPNSLLMGPPKLGPPPPGDPGCEYAGSSARQKMAEVRREKFFFMVREWVIARFNSKLVEMQVLSEALAQAAELFIQRLWQMTAKPG